MLHFGISCIVQCLVSQAFLEQGHDMALNYSQWSLLILGPCALHLCKVADLWLLMQHWEPLASFEDFLKTAFTIIYAKKNLGGLGCGVPPAEMQKCLNHCL